MSSDFKLDLVERLFAIDTEPKTPFNTQVILFGVTVDFTAFKSSSNTVKTSLSDSVVPFFLPLRGWKTWIWRC